MLICSHKVNNKLLRVEFVTRNFLLARKFYTVEVSKTSNEEHVFNTVNEFLTFKLTKYVNNFWSSDCSKPCAWRADRERRARYSHRKLQIVFSTHIFYFLHVLRLFIV